MSGGTTTHQTVRLAAGRHRSPAEGACVMELASMLAGERFSDRPRCVDPVLGAYLRDFNDRLSDHSRKRLLPYAALVVGTSGDRAATRARRDRCLVFAAGGMRPLGRPPRTARLRVLLAVGLRAALRLDRGAAQWAVRALDRRGVEPHGFALLDALVGRPSVADGAAPGPAAGPLGELGEAAAPVLAAQLLGAGAQQR